MLIFMLLMATGTLSGDQANQASALDVFMAEGRTQAVYKADLITDDRTFMRRIWLDLAGRLPERERVEKFLASGKRNKRFMEIDFLLASELFTERWTTFFADIFQNFAIFQQYAIYRNAFHDSLRDMVAQNMPWDEMARRIITGSGTGESPDTAMFFWTREAVEESFRLDYLDDQAAWITETMLGVQTLCISCHDGAGHLEQVNLDLTAKKREQFWGMAAFLASTYHYYPEINDDGLDEDEATQLLLRKLQLVDLDEPGYSGETFRLLPTLEGGDPPLNGEDMYEGVYHATSRPGQGMRPPRNGGIVAPVYLFNGEKPRPGETRRQALARILTADPQFARNMVNRVWAHLFGRGFVEPHNGWDLGRLNDATAQANGTTVQPLNGPLLTFLSDWFIDSGFDTRELVRMLAYSRLYQWDYASVEAGQGAMSAEDAWGFWRDNTRVQRIDAEAVLDNLNLVLGLQPKYVVNGRLDRVVTSAWQLPDPSEPSEFALSYLLLGEDGQIDLTQDLSHLGFNSINELLFYFENARNVLRAFGRGDYFNGEPRNDDNSIQNSLLLYNDYFANIWLEEPFISPTITSLASALNSGAMNRTQLINRLYQDVLFRSPTEEEAAAIMDHIQNRAPEEAVADAIWMLFNHPDFLYK